jgi:phage terminase large subunit-like protein
VWVRDGWLQLTPGEVCDYDHLRAQINTDRETFDVREVAFDPWNSTQLVNDLLADDAPMVKMRQGFVSMSPPTKELLRILLEGTKRRPKLRHRGDPLLRWQVDHLAVETDAAGNVKPSKKTSSDKIDGVVALIMGLDRAINRPPVLTSAYDEDGLTVV